MDPLTIGLIAGGVSALGSLGGAIGSSINTKKARNEENRYYQYGKEFLNSEYYRDPLSSVGYRSLIKSFDDRRRDEVEGMRNRAIAGGATVENQLAAMNALNRTESDFNAKLLQSVDARRQSLDAQKLSLEGQHSQNVRNNYLQDAYNWQAWGSAFGDAAMNVGNAFLLNKG